MPWWAINYESMIWCFINSRACYEAKHLLSFVVAIVMPKNLKKAKSLTDRPMGRPTDKVTCRVASSQLKRNMINKSKLPFSFGERGGLKSVLTRKSICRQRGARRYGTACLYVVIKAIWPRPVKTDIYLILWLRYKSSFQSILLWRQLDS